MGLNPFFIRSTFQTINITDDAPFTVLIPFSSGLHFKHLRQPQAYQRNYVLIPFSSGLHFKQYTYDDNGNVLSLNPFFIRSTFQTYVNGEIKGCMPVLIPFSSGLHFKRYAHTVIISKLMVLIPFSSGLHFKRY